MNEQTTATEPQGNRLARQRCPICHGEIAVRGDGALRKHPDHRHPKYGAAGAVRAGEVPVCDGSGQRLADERDIARGEELACEHGW